VLTWALEQPSCGQDASTGSILVDWPAALVVIGTLLGSRAGMDARGVLQFPF
jgi:hypothetical protein